MTEKPELNRRFGAYKAKLTNLDNFINDYDPTFVSIEEVESRLNSIEKTFEKTDEFVTQCARSLSDIDYNLFITAYNEFENMYHLLRSKLKVILKENKQDNSKSDLDNPCDTKPILSEKKISIKITMDQVPIFDGTDPMKWVAFRDIFLALIHTNKDLHDITKFTILKKRLSGTAVETIDHIPLSAAGYEKAWDYLVKRFNNNKLIIDCNIAALCNLPHLTKNNAVDLRSLLNICNSHMASLESLGYQINNDLSEMIILHLMTKKLDPITRKDWEDETADIEKPTFEKFRLFLDQKCRVLEAVSSNHNKNYISDNKINKSTHKPVQHKPSTFLSSCPNKAETLCKLCNETQHLLFQCPKFLKLDPQERYNKVKLFKLCINCFNPNHTADKCNSRSCKHCSKRHHSLLHFGKTGQSDNSNNHSVLTSVCETVPNSSQTSDLSCESQPKTTPILNSNQEAATQSFSCHNPSSKRILLATAILKVCNSKGNYIDCRVLLDSASQSNFVSQKFFDKLQLPANKLNNMSVKGLNNLSTIIQNSTSFTIYSKYSSYQKSLNFLIVPTITSSLPQADINISRWNLPSQLRLADPCFYASRPVDILLGAEIFFEIITTNQHKVANNIPILQESKLGWLIGGQCAEEIDSVQNVAIFSESHENSNNLEYLVKKFWEMESIPKKVILSAEEAYCEDHFIKNHERDTLTGKYIVSLALNKNIENIGESRDRALKRFMYLERKLSGNSDLKLQYSEFIQKYLNLQHMAKVENNDANRKPVFYLPHHAIVRPDKSSTKLRVVFDASAKSSSNISLNDTLLIGPQVQQDLFSIILRFRKHLFVFSSDICKMYRQVLLNREQTSLHRILWRFNPNESIEEYELKTVTYGTSSAPYLATRVLQQLVSDEGSNYPLGSKVLSNDFYVDDVLTGANTISTLLQIKNEVTELLQKGGFQLHKWCSNCNELLETISFEQREVLKNNKASSKECIKTLGLVWIPTDDVFMFNVPDLQSSKIVTKRSVLSNIAKLYDPLGLLAPIVITAKLFIQNLWKSQLHWDDPLSQEDTQFWLNFSTNLISINQLSIPRCIVTSGTIRFQIFGFSNASEKAYGACLYLKSINENNESSVQLICSKTRVAPLRIISLPRFELCAALLLSELVMNVIECLNMEFEHDIISRGIMPYQTDLLEEWWKGPEFILHFDPIVSKNNFMPNKPDISPSILELRSSETQSFVTEQIEHLDLFEKFSSLTKLQIIVAYCKRFISKCRKTNTSYQEHISVCEMEEALYCLVKIVQTEKFGKEISMIKNGKILNKSSIFQLSPFIDPQGILRVGGRLSNAKLPYDLKHQMLIPQNHALTHLIFLHFHKENLHCGAQQLLSLIRQRFWPINGKNQAKAIIRKCIPCQKAKPVLLKQLMGELPPERVERIRPFNVSGVDLCGPFNIKSRYQRSTAASKIYVASFVCFATKAIHLEILSDLTAKCFIACLKRFIYRRGRPNAIWSDNATNFIGANNEMNDKVQALISKIEYDGIQRFCTLKSINWKFIPPRSPNFGGL